MPANVISPADIDRGLMDGILPVYKEWGETPLQCLDRLRTALPALKDARLSYAGRLDPLAEGVMLVLVGDANADREAFLGLDKTYRVQVLLGASTDTGDLLGLPQDIIPMRVNAGIQEGELEAMQIRLDTLSGEQDIEYPAYSSKTVNGKPLFQWAKEGRLGEIDVPKKRVTIYSIKAIRSTEISSEALHEKARKAASSVIGDFRQGLISEAWSEFIGKNASRTFALMEIEVRCTSGTYMRSLAERIGGLFESPALAYSIVRTSVGDIDVGSAYKIDARS